jgi:hypothetical protein
MGITTNDIISVIEKLQANATGTRDDNGTNDRENWNHYNGRVEAFEECLTLVRALLLAHQSN